MKVRRELVRWKKTGEIVPLNKSREHYRGVVRTQKMTKKYPGLPHRKR